MPIALTTSKNTGDLDPNANAGKYAQAKITSFTIDNKEKKILVRVEYGNTVGGVWVSGILPPAFFTLQDVPDGFAADGAPVAGPKHYTTMVATLASATNKSIYALAGESLYQWLLDNNYLAGTMV